MPRTSKKSEGLSDAASIETNTSSGPRAGSARVLSWMTSEGSPKAISCNCRMGNSSEAIGFFPPTISTGKLGPEHRQPALRLGLGCFVLQNVPVFGEQAVGHTDDIGGDPVLRPSSVRE